MHKRYAVWIVRSRANIVDFNYTIKMRYINERQPSDGKKPERYQYVVACIDIIIVLYTQCFTTNGV